MLGTMVREISVSKGFIASIGIVYNLFIFLVFLTNKTLRENRTNRHTMNVILSHACINVAFLIETFLPTFISGRIALLPFYTCLYNLATLSFDRFLAVQYPFRYLEMRQISHVLLLVSGWLIAVFVYTLNRFIINIRIAFAIFTGLWYCITVILLVSLNLSVFLTTLRQRKTIESSLRRSTASHGSVSIKRSKENFRLSCACFGAVVTLLVFNAPSVTLMFVVESWDTLTWDIAMIFVVINSLVDPTLFLYFNSRLKQVIRGLKHHCTTSTH